MRLSSRPSGAKRNASRDDRRKIRRSRNIEPSALFKLGPGPSSPLRRGSSSGVTLFLVATAMATFTSKSAMLRGCALSSNL